MLEVEMDFDYERWVVGYEGKYSVTRDGKVFSHLRGRKTEMKQSSSYVGTRRGFSYPCLNLSFNGVYKLHKTHRLVAKAFIPNPDNKPCVNHIDGNKTNPSADNLEWVTHSENTRHGYKEGLIRGPFLTGVEKYVRAVDSMFGIGTPSNRKYVTDALLVKNGIPPEIKQLTQKAPNYLKQWLKVLELFELCESSLYGSVIARKLGVSESLISRVRSGEREKLARRIYHKYKDDPQYRVHG